MAAPSGWLTEPITVEKHLDHLVECIVENAAGTLVTLRFSRRGFATGASAITTSQGDSIAAHTPFAKRIIAAPVIDQSLWTSGQIGGASFRQPSQVVLNNADGGLDQYAPDQGYKWRGREIYYYVVDVRDGTTIKRLMRGVITSASWSLGVVEIAFQSREAIFDEAVSRRVYRGTGPFWLELDSNTGTSLADFGSPAALDLTGDMSVEGWFWFETFGALSQGLLYGWTGFTAAPWAMFVHDTTPNFRFIWSESAVAKSKDHSSTIVTGRWYHIAMIVSGSTLKMILWDDDAQTETVEDFTGLGTRDAQSGNVVRVAASSSINHGRSVWMDDLRVWNTARTLAEIRSNRHRPLDVNGLPAACVHYLRMNDGGVSTTVTDASATGANGTIAVTGTGSSTWLRGTEGQEDLAGALKPDQWGDRFGCEPVLVDPVDYVYQTAGWGAQQDQAVTEGANPITEDTDATTLRGFLTTTPAAGQVIRYLARGLFKLEKQPTLPILAECQGYNDGAAGYANSVAKIFRDVATRRGENLLSYPGDFNTTDYTALETAGALTAEDVGLYIREKLSKRELFDELARTVGGYWGWVDNDDALNFRVFAGPAATADWDFDQRHIISLEPITDVEMLHEVTLRYRPSDKALTESEVAAAIKGTDAWGEFTRGWLEYSEPDPDTLDDYPPPASKALVVESRWKNLASAGAEARRRLSVLGGQPLAYRVRMTVAAAEVLLDQTVTLTYTGQVGDARLNLTTSRKWSVLRKRLDLQAGEVDLDIWGYAT